MRMRAYCIFIGDCSVYEGDCPLYIYWRLQCKWWRLPVVYLSGECSVYDDDCLLYIYLANAVYMTTIACCIFILHNHCSPVIYLLAISKVYEWGLTVYFLANSKVYEGDCLVYIYKGRPEIDISIKLDFFVAESFYERSENKKETWVEWRMRVVNW